jgi:Tol biopolymer transport system component
MKKINEDFTWLPDGRLLYPVRETGGIGNICNYWAVRIDPRTGKTMEKPKQLTNWTGFCMGSTSVSADGKQVVFLRWEGHMASRLAELVGGGTGIRNPRHFPLSESSDAVGDWTSDSKAVILVSNRSGHYGLYKQSLDEEMAQPLVPEGYGRDPHVSPDGNSVIYFGIGENGAWPAAAPEPVMRAPVNGGNPQRLFIAGPGSLLTCARAPSYLCAVGELSEDGDHLVVTAFDLVKGRGQELFRFALGANDGKWTLNLSPDGRRFAILASAAGPICILSVRGEILQKFPVKVVSRLDSVVWAADAKSLFVTADIQGGTEVLRVDLEGNARILWQNPGASWETLAHPSPDGRYLEFDGWTTSGNLWLMENF